MSLLRIDAHVFWGVSVGLLYILMMLTSRWIFIAQTVDRLTKAQIESVKSGLTLEQDRPQERTELEKIVIKETLGLLSKADGHLSKGRWSWFAWSGSQEISAWWLIHDAERQIPTLLARAHVRSRLRRALGELDELSRFKRRVWGPVLEKAIHPRSDVEDSRADLQEFLAELYDARDSKFAGLASLQNKITWAAILGVLMGSLAIGVGAGWLVFGGALGGLLSRLQRFLATRKIPTDYGLSWALIILSPVAGALSAIAGLTLLVLLNEVSLADLSMLPESLLEARSPGFDLIGLSVLLGVSERFFDRVVRLGEGKVAVGDGTEGDPSEEAEGST